MSIHQAPSTSRQRSTPDGASGSTRAGYGTSDPESSAYARGFEEADDWADDPDDEAWGDSSAPRILWGRIAILAGVLLLAFVVGRLTAGGDVAVGETTSQRIEQLTKDLEQTRAELDAARAGGIDAASSDDSDSAVDPAEPAPAEPGTAEPEAQAPEEPQPEAEPAAPESITYTVVPGDYMYGVAEKVYGNGRLWRTIAEANDLGPQAVINPGQTLIIPPKP